jgi:SnoaL-like domain
MVQAISREGPVDNARMEPNVSDVDSLESLVAIEAIKTLKARYFQALDFKDWKGYAALFTLDAVIDFSAQPDLINHGREEARPDPNDWIFRGGQAAADFIEPLFADVVTVHHGHDPQVTITGPNTAAGFWSLYDRLEFADEIFHGFGHYHDEYVRVGGEWLISQLVLTRIRGAWETRSREGKA